MNFSSIILAAADASEISLPAFVVGIVGAGIAGWFLEFIRSGRATRDRVEQLATQAVDVKLSGHTERLDLLGERQDRIEDRLQTLEADQRDHELKVASEVSALKIWIAENAAGKGDVREIVNAIQTLNNRVTELAARRGQEGR